MIRAIIEICSSTIDTFVNDEDDEAISEAIILVAVIIIEK